MIWTTNNRLEHQKYYFLIRSFRPRSDRREKKKYFTFHWYPNFNRPKYQAHPIMGAYFHYTSILRTEKVTGSRFFAKFNQKNHFFYRTSRKICHIKGIPDSPLCSFFPRLDVCAYRYGSGSFMPFASFCNDKSFAGKLD